MRLIEHAETGEIQRVMSTEGYGEEWVDRGEIPEGMNLMEATWTGEEIALSSDAAFRRLRAERNARLAASDYPPLFERPEAEQPAWRAYRQALRDLPENADPFAPEWPTPPA